MKIPKQKLAYRAAIAVIVYEQDNKGDLQYFALLGCRLFHLSGKHSFP